MSYQSSYAGYQSASGGDSSNEYNKLSSNISNNIQKISQNVNTMQRMVNQLGTPSDSESLRKQLNDTHNNTNELVKETSNFLKDISSIAHSTKISEQRQRRMLKDRLTHDFSDVLKNFQVIQRTALQKQKESVIRARANSGLEEGEFFNNASRNKNLIDLQSPSAERQQITLQLEEECDLQILREREQAIKKIESDIVGVNKIFKDLATIVHEHGETIDSIEANVENTHIRVAEGANDVAKAREYHRKSHQKLMKLIIFVFLLMSIVLIIWFVSK